MVISKEVLNAMRMCRRLTFVKRDDGKVYMICSDIEIKDLGVKVEKEFDIDFYIEYRKFYTTYYNKSTINIDTCLNFLKPNDDIAIMTKDVKMDDTTTLVEIHLRVRRIQKSGISKEYDFILSVTTPKYID